MWFLTKNSIFIARCIMPTLFFKILYWNTVWLTIGYNDYEVCKFQEFQPLLASLDPVSLTQLKQPYDSVTVKPFRVVAHWPRQLPSWNWSPLWYLHISSVISSWGQKPFEDLLFANTISWSQTCSELMMYLRSPYSCSGGNDWLPWALLFCLFWFCLFGVFSSGSIHKLG